MLTKLKATTGFPDLDRLIGGVLPGDNIIWEINSGVTVDRFADKFVEASETVQAGVVYVSFNRSPQTIFAHYANLISTDRFTLVDCFSKGKGGSDPIFLDFYKNTVHLNTLCVENPSNPEEIAAALTALESREIAPSRYVFDSITGMLGLWGDENKVLRFFSQVCPRLYDRLTVAEWLLETEAHNGPFLAKVRHVTQIVLDVALEHGIRTISVQKAAGRKSVDIGIPQRFHFDETGQLRIEAKSRADRELGLLAALGNALGSALDPQAFFERTMEILERELGIKRGTLVLLDSATKRLKIAAAHGLTAEERSKGDYAIGEGITGKVVETGQPEVVKDVATDPRFLNRTTARSSDSEQNTAFLCVPLKVDGEVVGALSVDRPFAVEATLDMDLRLITIVASTVAQVLKVNRILHVEKEEILTRDERIMTDLKSLYKMESIAGQSAAISKVLTTAAIAARSSASVLISGETGTGKEMVANVVHYNSDRAKGPIVKVNCGALPESLLESELFGHVRGAFTGAIRDRKGRFELAHGGTLFLDEVAEMSPRLQVKLLRVLQEREFEPVGDIRTIRVDVRIVAASNRDLKVGIKEGWFREDLYYRLNVIPIHLPPLRERREDIPALVDHFLNVCNARNRTNVSRLTREVLDLLVSYDWPGNVRELENCIERVVVMSPGDTLSLDLLPEEIVAQKKKNEETSPPSPGGQLDQAIEHACGQIGDLGRAREHLLQLVEKAVIRRGLATGKSQRELAETLGVSRMTLRKKIRELGIE